MGKSILRHQDTIQQIFSGLHNTEFRSFSHDITFENARASVLTSDAGFSEFYLEQGFPYICTNKNGRFLLPGIYLNNGLATKSTDFPNIFEKISIRFNFNYSIHILEHEADCQHLYSFNLFKPIRENKNEVADFNINQMSLMLYFLQKYKHEAKELIVDAKRACNRFEFVTSEKEEKLSKINEYYQNIHSHRLSARQKECLYYLGQGMRTKQIARILNLTPKTVDNYFETIKIKLNCYSRSELVEYCYDKRQ